jgi:hypothetical protein
MQSENVPEYKAVREEITTIKNCITTYVGIVVLGSATSFWGLAARASEKEPERLAMGFVSILLGITSMFVLFLLSYKFTSHNRCAGYSKLLTQERFELKDPIGDNCSCWEICLDRLRASDSKLEGLSEYYQHLKIKALSSCSEEELEEQFKDISGSKPEKDHWGWGWFYGCSLMLWSSEGMGSWKFPVYIARIFAAMDVIFVLFAAYFLHSVSGQQYIPPGRREVLLLLLFVALGLSWMTFASKLFKQMDGSETVEAFCWKFMPIRAKFLRELNKDVDVKYDLVGVSVKCKGKGSGTGAGSSS